MSLTRSHASPALGNLPTAGDFGLFHGHRVRVLVSVVAQQQGFEFRSCLDIGCGRRPLHKWFERFSGIPNPRFIGAEVDEGILEELWSQGIDAVNPLATGRDISCDLAVALEVIEHLTPTETLGFLNFCARNARKMFAMTTSNFEYWPGLRAADKELRWAPDHFRDFRPLSTKPHHHKQEMTREILSGYFKEFFPQPAWDWRIFRAWPWKITDEARGRTWTVYFKLFGIAWRLTP